MMITYAGMVRWSCADLLDELPSDGRSFCRWVGLRTRLGKRALQREDSGGTDACCSLKPSSLANRAHTPFEQPDSHCQAGATPPKHCCVLLTATVQQQQVPRPGACHMHSLIGRASLRTIQVSSLHTAAYHRVTDRYRTCPGATSFELLASHTTPALQKAPAMLFVMLPEISCTFLFSCRTRRKRRARHKGKL